MKLLHITFHSGCQLDLDYVFGKLLGHTIQTMRLDDGETVGNDIYNVTKERAQKCWDKYSEFFNTFDGIVTSDTCPTSRPFLQNNWSKLLIIWVCNRFDYSVTGDEDFYNLLRDIPNKKNVYIIGYTPFEHVYAKYIKNVVFTDMVIKPLGKHIVSETMTKKYKETDESVFYVPLYHNETILMNLSDKLNELGIKNHHGLDNLKERFNHVSDLLKYKGIICIPYAWSNLKFFEAMQLGIIFFIPSMSFLLELSASHRFFWSPPFFRDPNVIKLSEWYCDEYKDLLVFYDSWEDLAEKVKSTDYEAQTAKILTYSHIHSARVVLQWHEVFKNYKSQLSQA